LGQGNTTVTFRLKVIGGGSGLLRFSSNESSSPNKPLLLTAKQFTTAIAPKIISEKENITSLQSFKDYIKINSSSPTETAIFSIRGNCLYQTSGVGEYSIDIRHFPVGIYLLYCKSESSRIVEKMIRYTK
jgi:hypothetical protein